ncbi:peptidase MA family metallohydrolase, partial [Candidatus Kryptonium thompsonii]|uniref:peptidase MA family metallohydrolase n=1 Tax=Candidatus Kryptonium thompsonii TaxID=1633631 RepID=UPI00070841BE
MKRFFVYLVLIFALISVGFAQQGPFGKNKVQYKDFAWYFIRTDHFDIYFTDGGYELAEYTAKVAEDAYVKISKLLRYEIINRIPIVVYNSHNDFQQTNVVAEYLEEGIGGVTELFKNRVVVPFEGSYRQFRHVIHHELVHAVMNDMFYGGSLQSALINNIQLQLPMWIVEGLPEFSALRWDVNSDMFMRDATVSDYLQPIEYLDGYFAYRGGQSVFWYISRKYGDEKIGEIINRIRGLRSVEAGIKSSLGISLKELSDRWVKEQKKLYWADFSKREAPDEFAKRLTDHAKKGNFYNTSPTISPTGDRIAFISDRDDYFDVFIMSAIDGKIIKKIVKGNRTKNFEELHLLTPGLTWSPDGNKIALAVKSGDRDAIFIIDVKTEKQQKITFDLEGIFSVDWSRDGTKLAFVGLKHGQSDIYVYDLSNKTLVNLTDDIFSDADPTWSPDGKLIYFSSDRKDFVSRDVIPHDFKMYNFDPNQYDIYSVDLETREIKRITHTDYWDETSPV